ncbi:hypothetical protein HY464_00395, partial [Candidatus Peregrinibacteria bacterium]|nr:hypothetical protein [Candidatus Peregrinibacteria bacterium]
MFRIGLIIGLTFLVYGQSLGNAFVRWDDSMLIYENPIVREISWKSLKAAFTTYDPELYIPLTFLSYQIDYAIGGMHPFMFHLTNLVLHTLNAVLVFFLVTLLGIPSHARGRNSSNPSPCPLPWGEGNGGPHFVAFAVATIWAIHPLNTEAVAWASARKDVLSTFFFLLSIILYLRYRNEKRET